MLNLFQNDSESGMIPFPEYFIRNLYVHRFRLSSRSADTRRRIVRWLFLHFHVYDYHPADAETTGRYLSRERFPPLLFMTLTEDFRKDSSLCLRIISTDFYTLYLEGTSIVTAGGITFDCNLFPPESGGNANLFYDGEYMYQPLLLFDGQ